MRSWSEQVVSSHLGSESPAVVSGEHVVAGSRLLAMAAGTAEWLDSLGLRAGSPLPVLSTLRAETIAMLLAGAGTGHPLAPLGTRLTPAEVSAAVSQMDSEVLLHEPAFARLAEEVGQRTGVRPVCVGELPDGADLARLQQPDPDSVGLFLHTSGTTGAPKRVPMTQRVLLRRAELLAGLTGLGQCGAVYATGSPMHHIGGLGNVLVALSTGTPVVGAESFSVEWWRGLAAYGVTHALLVPSMIEMLLAAGALDAVPLRTLIYGASPIRPETLRRVLTVLPDVRLVNLFGQTEGSPITCLTGDDHVRAAEGDTDLLRSVGRAAPGVRLRFDTDGEREAGELWACAEHLCLAGQDGWLRTGDLARQDSEGYVYLVGRTHDRIVRGGENIYPVEVERVLESHPTVASAGVVGVADRRLGQTPAAFVVPTDPDSTVDVNELTDHVRAQLAGFKVPARWYLVSQLPYTSAGKLLRRELVTWGEDQDLISRRLI